MSGEAAIQARNVPLHGMVQLFTVPHPPRHRPDVPATPNEMYNALHFSIDQYLPLNISSRTCTNPFTADIHSIATIVSLISPGFITLISRLKNDHPPPASHIIAWTDLFGTSMQIVYDAMGDFNLLSTPPLMRLDTNHYLLLVPAILRLSPPIRVIELMASKLGPSSAPQALGRYIAERMSLGDTTLATLSFAGTMLVAMGRPWMVSTYLPWLVSSGTNYDRIIAVLDDDLVERFTRGIAFYDPKANWTLKPAVRQCVLAHPSAISRLAVHPHFGMFATVSKSAMM
jgi:hypothetical protein